MITIPEILRCRAVVHSSFLSLVMFLKSLAMFKINEEARYKIQLVAVESDAVSELYHVSKSDDPNANKKWGIILKNLICNFDNYTLCGRKLTDRTT